MNEENCKPMMNGFKMGRSRVWTRNKNNAGTANCNALIPTRSIAIYKYTLAYSLSSALKDGEEMLFG